MEARDLGLVQRVYPDEEFGSKSLEYIALIAGNAPLSLAAAKRALIELDKPIDSQDVAVADLAAKLCNMSADYEEGRNAFREKRLPIFTGK